MVSRGRLIAFEGIDGAGTTTQARLLVDWLQARGLAAHLTWEPSTGPVGELLRKLLRQEAAWPLAPAAVALLFAADRVDHYQHEIAPHLAAGAHVVTDRYVYSSLAYQSLDQDPGWVEAINREAPEPDLTLYVRVPPDLARQRREARGGAPELYDDSQLQERISAQYDILLGSSPAAGSWILDPAGSGWIPADPAGSEVGIRPDPERPRPHPDVRTPLVAILDGSLPVETLHQRIRRLVEKVAQVQGS